MSFRTFIKTTHSLQILIDKPKQEITYKLNNEEFEIWMSLPQEAKDFVVHLILRAIELIENRGDKEEAKCNCYGVSHQNTCPEWELPV